MKKKLFWKDTKGRAAECRNHGDPAPLARRSQGGAEGETSEWTCRSLALVLALGRGSRTMTPTSQTPGSQGSAQGAVAMGMDPRSPGGARKKQFLMKAEQGIQTGRYRGNTCLWLKI